MENKCFFESEIGLLCIKENGEAITQIFLADEKEITECNKTPLLQDAVKQLQEYFRKQRKSFELPLAPKGTEFQKKVWKVLQEIPYGETRSYKQIAELAGSPKGARAVGLSNNKNPIMIVVPCHRVIGSSGKLVGYAGGIDIKIRLLDLEN